MRKIFFVIFALAVIVSACAPAPTATPVPPTAAPTQVAAPVPPPQPTKFVPPRGGEYRIANTGDAPTLHPFKSTDTASNAYISRMFTGAVWRYNPETLDPEPWMMSWKVSDDFKTVTFTLNDIKWSDGKPVTAFDFQWTFDQAMKEENKWPYRADPARNIVSYKALDAKTLQVSIKDGKPLPVLLNKVDVLNTPLPQHIWEKYDWNDPKTNPEILQPSVVNGQFLLKEWKRDDHATFTRNDSYFKGSPNIESITYRIVPNSQVSLQMLLNGEVDAGAVSNNDFEKAKASDKLNLYQWDPAAASWSYIGFNLRRAPQNDVEFRHALAYAIPRDVLSKTVYNNLSKPTFSTFPPTSPFFNPNVPKYDFNMDTAKATLDKAGYKLDKDGNRLGKDGKPIKLKLMHNVPSPAREKVAVIAQEQFKQLGIQVEIITLEFGAYLQALKKEPYDWDLDLLGWSVPIEPSGVRDIWAEATIPDLNSVAYVNKKQEDLWDQGEKEFDPAKRKLIYQEIQRILAEDSPYIFTVYDTGWTFYNKRVTPNKATRVGVAYEFFNWFITPGTTP